jgi:hypothetical protein
MPGNSLALQMPPAHPFENFDSGPEFSISAFRGPGTQSLGIPALRTQRAIRDPLVANDSRGPQCT